MKNIWNFLSHQPVDDEQFPPRLFVEIKSQKYYKLLDAAILKNSSNVIFITGPWGSGKTVTIKSWSKSNYTSWNVKFTNFFGVTTAEESLAHLIGFGWRFLIFILVGIILFAVYYNITEYTYAGLDLTKDITLKAIIGTVLGFLYTFVLKPKNRFLLLLSLIPKVLISYMVSVFSSKKCVFVIEDLDRSSLSISERFSFLSQLPPMNGRYLITYGYSSETEKIQLTEYINKVNGIAIHLNQDPEITLKILASLFDFIPFNKPEPWLSEVSIRDHLSFLYRVERENLASNAFIKRVSALAIYVEYIRSRVVAHEPGRDGSDLSLQFNGARFSVSSGGTLTPRESSYTNAFCKSIDAQYFQKCFQQYATSEEKNHSSNWNEVIWHRLNSDESYLIEFSNRILQ